MATRRALAGLRRLWESRGKFRAKSAARKAPDLLPHYPVITVKRLSRLLAVSLPSARAAVGQRTG
jgi:hypothetical protein